MRRNFNAKLSSSVIEKFAFILFINETITAEDVYIKERIVIHFTYISRREMASYCRENKKQRSNTSPNLHNRAKERNLKISISGNFKTIQFLINERELIHAAHFLYSSYNTHSTTTSIEYLNFFLFSLFSRSQCNQTRTDERCTCFIEIAL